MYKKIIFSIIGHNDLVNQQRGAGINRFRPFRQGSGLVL